MEKENTSPLWEMGYKTIQELETEHGILASGKQEIFGCIFGRDSLITSLELLKSYKKMNDPYFLSLVRKVLLNLASLQGTKINIESGEEPGKCIHEYRPNDHDHLTKTLAHPWYVYPDNAMRNYDTVDATPLFLIAVYEYYRISKDETFLKKILPHVHYAIDWILIYGDSNRDGLIDYRFHPDRKYGGLRTQSWMDSSESLFREEGGEVSYPVAPVEVQAYAYSALRAWADYFKPVNAFLSRRLTLRATKLKKLFNQKFVMDSVFGFSLAFAIDGEGHALIAPRSSMGHVLWAIWKPENGPIDSVLDGVYVPKLIERLMAPDLFEPRAGIRTLSKLSSHFDPLSYHNGSIWPHDNALIIEGLENFGYTADAMRLRHALIAAYKHFKTPIELFVFKDGRYRQYKSAGGQRACKKQAWSAAAMLAESTKE